MEVVIDELRENTFYAKIILEVSALTNEVDARPSDAIALAVRTQSPIYVAEKVMEAAAFLPSEESGKEERLSQENPGNKKEEVPKTKEAKIASLQNKLKEAIAAEEYEKAAKLRDDIQRLTNTN